MNLLCFQQKKKQEINCKQTAHVKITALFVSFTAVAKRMLTCSRRGEHLSVFSVHHENARANENINIIVFNMRAYAPATPTCGFDW